ncbi:hypothetical protein [Endozoicomonas sp. SCSIO W0465]|nr:hypothetical protein [Endozoicomonas sp. SCSIO W0465]USE34555.1 hypothetical protein MJO57_20760 [Endozoicomonas sp. SCSIO W0465]
MAIFSQQFPEGIVYQGLWPIFIAEQSVTRKEPQPKALEALLNLGANTDG